MAPERKDGMSVSRTVPSTVALQVINLATSCATENIKPKWSYYRNCCKVVESLKGALSDAIHYFLVNYNDNKSSFLEIWTALFAKMQQLWKYDSFI